MVGIRGNRNGRGRRRAAAVAVGAGALLGAMALAAPASAVIGGTDATEEYGFMTALYDDKGNHYCGGALVAEQWVLTAAHCTDTGDVPVDRLSVRVGSNDQTKGGSERTVAGVVEHPEFEAEDVGDDPDYPNSQYLLRNDLALIKLDAPVEQAPVRIAPDRPQPGTEVRALGWGMVDEFGEKPKPDILQQLDTEIVADDRCAELDGDLCSEHPTDEAQTCTTDSGGPIIRGREGAWELVGVTSRDGDFDESPLCVGPGVATDAAKHAAWITTTTTP